MPAGTKKFLNLLLLFLHIQLSAFPAEAFQKREILQKLSVTDSLEMVLKKTEQDTNRVILLNKLSFRYLLEAAFDKALSYAQQAGELSKTLGYKRGLTKSLINTGNVYQERSDFESAKKQYLLSYELAVQEKNTLLIEHSTNNLGEVYRKQFNYEKSLYYYLEALKAAKLLNSPKEEGEVLNNMGLIHAYQGHNKKAIDFFEKATTISKKLDDKYTLSFNLMNMASMYFGENNMEKALSLNLEALKLRTETGYTAGMANCLSEIGSIYIKLKKYGEARSYYMRAIELAEKLNDTKTLSFCYNYLGVIYSEEGQNKKAIEYVKKALSYAIRSGYKNTKRSAYRNLSEMLARENNFKEAFHYHQLFSQYNDSLFNSESSSRIADMQTRYESELKEKEISVLQSKRQAQEQKIELLQKTNEIKKLTIIALAAGITLLLVLGIFLYQWNQSRLDKKMRDENMKHQKEQLAAIVQAQEEERNRIAKDLHDGVGQLLAGLKLRIENVLPDISGNAAAGEKLKASARLLDDTVKEVRSISHQMMPHVLNESGLVPALGNMLNKALSGTEIKYDFQHLHMEERLPKNTEINLYRISQELINNILKHAQANEITIRIFKSSQQIVLMIEDDGKGFDYAELKNKGLGLMNITFRAQMINGEVNFERGFEKGTIATIRIPLVVHPDS